MRRFLWFSAVGTLGFGVDSATLYLCVFGAGLDLYSGRVLSYLAAATTTWFLNRHLTFADSDKRRPIREWARFLLANAAGGLINYTSYAASVTAIPVFAEHPVLGVAIGSLAGLAVNFTLSKWLVFATR